MKDQFLRSEIFDIYLFLVLLCFNITNLLVMPIWQNRQLHIHHIITFLFFIWTMLHYKEINLKKFHLKYNMIIAYYIYALIISFVLAIKYGIGGTVVNVIYCLMLYIIISFWEDVINWEHLEKIIQYVGYLFAVFIVINLLFQWEKIIDSFQRKTTHLLISTLVAGGQNIEATFLATYACFLLYKKKYGFWMFSLFISILYSSRIAILLNILSLILFLVSHVKREDIKDINKRKKIYFYWVALFAIVMGIICSTGRFEHMIKRFLNIGKDNGSTVRIEMWLSAFQVFIRNPFGVGLGNAIVYAEDFAKKSFKLSNIHCVYLQAMVETGVIGLALFLISVFQIIYKAKKSKFLNPLGAMTIGYFFCCILQFRGIEPLYIIILLLFMIIDDPFCNFMGDRQRKGNQKNEKHLNNIISESIVDNKIIE